jgi:outer membrane beta-barrel protein
MSNPLDPRTRTVGLVATVLGTLALVVATLAPSVAHAADDVPAPALDALRQLRGDAGAKNVIQNKFFVKTERFEVAPALGTMPNNSFVVNPYGGAVLAYHFSETLAAEGTFLYAPNTGVGGVKGLTKTLVAIAHDTGTQELEQPLDRLQLGALFAARWAPVYGKINLLGEGVANFDLYGTAGAGLLLITKDTAVYNTDFERDPNQPIVLVNPEAPTAAHVAVNLGMGMDFFFSQSMALKLDARGAFYMAPEPDYGNGNQNPENRLYTPFLTTAGVSFFFPKMKPRDTF